MVRSLGWLLLALAVLTQPARAQQRESGTGAVTLRPGDILRIEIWREEDLSGDFLVDEQGQVTLPMLGTKRVVDTPVGVLRGTLIDEYRVHLRNPSIAVIPLRRINILGEVTKPGLYPVDPTVTLAGVVALAGGTTPTGDLNRIRVLRENTVIRERVGAGETLSDLDIRSGDQIIVDRRGWVERNSTFLVSVLLSTTSIIVTLITQLK